jgi:hypothetical protein
VTAVQVYVAPTAAPGVTGTVTLPGAGPGCSLVNPVFIGAIPPSPPAGTSFPFGLFDFSASGCGASVTVQIVYSQPLPAGTQYWKYGPTPGGPPNDQPHWYVMPNASVNGTTVTLTIQDGQIGDDDLLANGIIVDQGGPGASIGASAAVEIPTLSSVMLAALALLLVVMGWARDPLKVSREH